MRRAVVWTGILVLSLLTAALGLLILTGSQAPLDFLQGQTPVRMHFDKAEAASLEEAHVQVLVYSFQGDFAQFKARADKELKAKGLDGWTEGQEVIYSQPEPSYKFGSVGERIESKIDVVRIVRDAKVEGGPFRNLVRGQTKRAKGWITVTVVGTDQRSWVDNIRNLLGL